MTEFSNQVPGTSTGDYLSFERRQELLEEARSRKADVQPPQVINENNWPQFMNCQDRIGELDCDEGDAERRINAAKDICAGCTVTYWCLRFATETIDGVGIKSGLTLNDRKKLANDELDLRRALEKRRQHDALLFQRIVDATASTKPS